MVSCTTDASCIPKGVLSSQPSRLSAPLTATLQLQPYLLLVCNQGVSWSATSALLANWVAHELPTAEQLLACRLSWVPSP